MVAPKWGRACTASTEITGIDPASLPLCSNYRGFHQQNVIDPLSSLLADVKTKLRPVKRNRS
jgi:hypothetical protein